MKLIPLDYQLGSLFPVGLVRLPVVGGFSLIKEAKP
jgi:hypothetical protein